MIPVICGAQGASEVSDGRDSNRTVLSRANLQGVLPDMPAVLLDAFPTTPLATPSPVPAQGRSQPTGTAVAGTQDDEKREGIAGTVDDGLLHDAFLAGYRHGGGAPVWEQRVLAMVQCESSWSLDPPGFHLGLAQFEVGTWEKAKCSSDADYRSPWEQGCAVASWMTQVAPYYGSRAGWPNCWGS